MPRSRAHKKGRGHRIDPDGSRLLMHAATNGFSKGASGSDSIAQSIDDETEVSSVTSICSEPHSDRSSVGQGAAAEEIDEVSQTEEVEDKIKEAIDGLTEKSAKHRQDCLRVICKAFSTCNMDEILETNRETIADGVEKCIRRGKGEEKSLAAEVIALLSIQIGSDDSSESMFHNFKTILTPIILDQSAGLKSRAKCCEALGVYCFIAAEDMADILDCMRTLESIFSSSYMKGDGTMPVVNAALAELHNSALSAWSLLLSICPWSKVSLFTKSHLPRLPELLSSSDVTIRIMAGETIALFYEILYSEDDAEMAGEIVDEAALCSQLKQLATDSNKYRAKKDRRQQRSSFRDILRTVEDGESPDDTIKFGSEVLCINSWTRKRQYAALRDIIGTGMNFHLKENDFLRDIFDLGPALLEEKNRSGSRGSHFERHLYNQAAFKVRTKVRGKLRDKRTAFRT